MLNPVFLIICLEQGHVLVLDFHMLCIGSHAMTGIFFTPILNILHPIFLSHEFASGFLGQSLLLTQF
jgi:hypothetical protein